MRNVSQRLTLHLCRPQLKAMAAVAKTEEQELKESSGTEVPKPLAEWCTCGRHTEDDDESTSTIDDAGIDKDYKNNSSM